MMQKLQDARDAELEVGTAAIKELRVVEKQMVRSSGDVMKFHTLSEHKKVIKAECDRSLKHLLELDQLLESVANV